MSRIRKTIEDKRIERMYPVVYLDATTTRNLLNMLMTKGIFSDYNKLPTREDLLDTFRKKYGKSSISPDEERAALKNKEYKNNGYVVKDCGEYAIAFNANLYKEHIEIKQHELEDKMVTSDFNNNEVLIQEKLRKFKLYKLAGRIAILVLAMVYLQKTCENVLLIKSQVMEILGFKPKDRQAYNEIRNAIETLRWMDYLVYDHKVKERIGLTGSRPSLIGNFIYNLSETGKSFSLDVNPKFVGCVLHLMRGEEIKRDDRSYYFSRGYIDFPLAILPTMRNNSIHSLHLLQFLLAEKGNARLSDKTFKTVIQKVGRFVEIARIPYQSRPDRQYAGFIKALKKINIIQGLEPSLSDLKLLKASDGLKTTLRIRLFKHGKDMNLQLLQDPKVLFLGQKWGGK